MSWIGTKHLFANLQGEEAWRKIDPSLRSGWQIFLKDVMGKHEIITFIFFSLMCFLKAKMVYPQQPNHDSC
jgi:hypothetical protein